MRCLLAGIHNCGLHIVVVVGISRYYFVGHTAIMKAFHFCFFSRLCTTFSWKTYLPIFRLSFHISIRRTIFFLSPSFSFFLILCLSQVNLRLHNNFSPVCVYSSWFKIPLAHHIFNCSCVCNFLIITITTFLNTNKSPNANVTSTLLVSNEYRFPQSIMQI